MSVTNEVIGVNTCSHAPTKGYHIPNPKLMEWKGGNGECVQYSNGARLNVNASVCNTKVCWFTVDCMYRCQGKDKDRSCCGHGEVQGIKDESFTSGSSHDFGCMCGATARMANRDLH